MANQGEIGLNPASGQKPSDSGYAATYKNKKDTTSPTQMNSMQSFAFLVMLFIGLKDEEAEPPVADESLLKTISSALGLNFDKFHDTIEDVKSGKTSAVSAAAKTFAAIDLSKANFSKAESAFKSYNHLNDLPPVTNANFLKSVDVILKLEGGWNPNEPDGGVANFGINNRANPDIDVRNLTQSAAVQLYKTRYWDKIEGIDKLDQRTALVAFDLAVNSGVGRANKMLKESGGDVGKLMELREKFYDKLIADNPQKYAKYEKSWDNRMAQLETAVKAIPTASTTLLAEQKSGLTATHAQTIASGGKAESTPPASGTQAFTLAMTTGGTNETLKTEEPVAKPSFIGLTALTPSLVGTGKPA